MSDESPQNRPGPVTTRDPHAVTTRDQPPAAVPNGRAATTRDGQPRTTRDAGIGTVRDGHDFGPAVPATDFPLPDYLARDYIIVDDDLTAGGEADVAVIQHRSTGVLKVVKVYRRGITLPQSFVDGLAAADPRHVLPVVRSTYTGWTSPRFVEVMDYLPDGSLESLLQRYGGSAPDRARDILEEMTDALSYIHDELRIVHRDIKPANILIRTMDPFDLVLADLGIAAEVAELRRSRRETTGGVKGTLIYQSPETLNMSDAGAPRDWWALGMTLCEVLTGQHPFKDGAGHTLHDENRIRHAITMGAIDVSVVNDPRWNLLLRGLLAHRPEDRWGAPQIRQWLNGESPLVADYRPADDAERVVPPYRLLGARRFTDPVALADHLVTHWDDATAVFTSADECRVLAAWIRDDVRDGTIDVNSMSAITDGDESKVDARIIEFTTHYRGSADLTFRGRSVRSGELAARYLQSGESWKRDPLLWALHPNVVAALAESQLDDTAGPQNQSEEYYALARLARFAQQTDAVIEAAQSAIMNAAVQYVEGTDVGVDLRESLPARAEQSRGMARAALLSPACRDDVQAQFTALDSRSPDWFADLASRGYRGAPDPAGSAADADPQQIGIQVLATRVADLAIHYEQSCRAAREAAERARREAAAAADASARRGVARRLSDGDLTAVKVAAVAAITVVIPWLIGHFLLTKTFVLKADPAVYEPDIRGLGDHFLATYLGGLVPILLAAGVFVVARRPWDMRMRNVVLGWVVIGATLLVLLPTSMGKWETAERHAADQLRETAFPFAKRFLQCASWNIGGENGLQQPELWQVHLGQLQGTPGRECNRVLIYRGWQLVNTYDLPSGKFFTGNIVVNYQGWPEPYKDTGGGNIFSQNTNTGVRQPMNPKATSIDLGVDSGQRLVFTLAGEGPFDLR